MRIHSLQTVLDDGLLYPALLHSHCPQLEGVVGTYPTGVPLNVKPTGTQISAHLTFTQRVAFRPAVFVSTVIVFIYVLGFALVEFLI